MVDRECVLPSSARWHFPSLIPNSSCAMYAMYVALLKKYGHPASALPRHPFSLFGEVAAIAPFIAPAQCGPSPLPLPVPNLPPPVLSHFAVNHCRVSVFPAFKKKK
eukprot:RCo013493